MNELIPVIPTGKSFGAGWLKLGEAVAFLPQRHGDRARMAHLSKQAGLPNNIVRRLERIEPFFGEGRPRFSETANRDAVTNESLRLCCLVGWMVASPLA
jgi:hypothetical protein